MTKRNIDACQGRAGRRSEPRVLLASPTDAMGGAEVYLKWLADYLRRESHDVTIAIPGGRPGTAPLRAFFVQREIPVVALAELAPRGSTFAEWWQLLRNTISGIRLIARVRPAAVVLSLPAPTRGFGLLTASRMTRTPVLVVFHLVRHDVTFGWLRRVLMRWLSRGRITWVAVSAHNAAVLEGVVPALRGRVLVVHNGVELPGHNADELVGSAVRARYGIASTDRLVVSVGRLTAQKGYDALLPAIPKVLAAVPNARFVWLGEGPERGALETELRRLNLLDRVMMPGNVEDVGDHLAAADLFVMASRDEGAPFSLLEAMAAHVPVAVASSGPLIEVVPGDAFGWTFEAKEPASIAAAITDALSRADEAERRAEGAYQRVDTVFSRALMLQRVSGLLDELLD